MAKELSADKVKLSESIKKAVGKETKADGRAKKEKMRVASQLKAGYCRHCNKFMEYDEFYVTTNPYIDKNGKLSICKACLLEIFNDFYYTYQDYKKAFFSFCQNVDIIYDEKSVENAIRLLTEDPRGENIVTKYWRAVKNNIRGQSIRYKDSKVNATVQNSLEKTTADERRKQLKLIWGEFSDQDYEYLENTYNEYTSSFGISGPNERDGYRVLAILLLKQRETPANRDIIAAIKAQYEMLGIDPKQLRKESKEKGARTLGIEIATMEKTEPAEFYQDKKMYFDYDGLEKDIIELKRAQKNHLTGSRDFNNINIDIEDIE